MIPIIESDIDCSKLYLLYTCSRTCKEINVFRIIGGETSVVLFIRVFYDFSDTRSIISSLESNVTRKVNNIKWFKSMQLKDFAIFELSDTEADLILAQII